MANDPFATPQVQRTQSVLEPMGIHTAYSNIFPEEVADYKAPADNVARPGRRPWCSARPTCRPSRRS